MEPIICKLINREIRPWSSGTRRISHKERWRDQGPAGELQLLYLYYSFDYLTQLNFTKIKALAAD
jgi:hypothetical protein